MSQKKGNNAVFGIYDDESVISSVMDRFKVAGFTLNDVSILVPSKEAGQKLALQKSSKVFGGAIIGIFLGLVIGGYLGWIAGNGVILSDIRHYTYGAFVNAGPRQSSVEFAIMGGYIFGIIGGLIGLAQPVYEAKRYESHTKKGGVLLSVHVDDSLKKKQAKKILKDSGAHGVAAEHEKSTKRLEMKESAFV